MDSYNSQVYDARDHMLNEILKIDKGETDMVEMGRALDNLNKAWDNLTDCLLRQREERDKAISDLLNQLAEAKRER